MGYACIRNMVYTIQSFIFHVLNSSRFFFRRIKRRWHYSEIASVVSYIMVTILFYCKGLSIYYMCIFGLYFASLSSCNFVMTVCFLALSCTKSSLIFRWLFSPGQSRWPWCLGLRGSPPISRRLLWPGTHGICCVWVYCFSVVLIEWAHVALRGV